MKANRNACRLVPVIFPAFLFVFFVLSPLSASAKESEYVTLKAPDGWVMSPEDAALFPKFTKKDFERAKKLGRPMKEVFPKVWTKRVGKFSLSYSRGNSICSSYMRLVNSYGGLFNGGCAWPVDKQKMAQFGFKEIEWINLSPRENIKLVASILNSIPDKEKERIKRVLKMSYWEYMSPLLYVHLMSGEGITIQKSKVLFFDGKKRVMYRLSLDGMNTCMSPDGESDYRYSYYLSTKSNIWSRFNSIIMKYSFYPILWNGEAYWVKRISWEMTEIYRLAMNESVSGSKLVLKPVCRYKHLRIPLDW